MYFRWRLTNLLLRVTLWGHQASRDHVKNRFRPKLSKTNIYLILGKSHFCFDLEMLRSWVIEFFIFVTPELTKNAHFSITFQYFSKIFLMVQPISRNKLLPAPSIENWTKLLIWLFPTSFIGASSSKNEQTRSHEKVWFCPYLNHI